MASPVLLSYLEGWLGNTDAGVVNKNVQPPKVVHDAVNGRANACDVQHVQFVGATADSLRLHPRLRVAGKFQPRTHVGNGDVGSRFGQPHSQRRPDAASRAGHRATFLPG